MSMLSMIGLLGGLILLIILTLRGVNLFIAAPICALLVALSSGMAIFPVSADTNFINAYMDGFAGFLSAWFFISYWVLYSVSSWKTPVLQTVLQATLWVN